MKTLLKIAACASISLALATFSQGAEKMMKKDHIMMKDGKVMVQKSGKASMLESPMELENGSTVKPDGTVMMKDGKTMMMKDGDSIDMTGTMMKGHKKEADAATTAGTNSAKNTKTPGSQPAATAGGDTIKGNKPEADAATKAGTNAAKNTKSGE